MNDFAHRFQTDHHPVWLQVGRMFPGTGTEVLTNAHLVYDGHSIRHAATAPPPAQFVRPGQMEPDAILPRHTALPGLTDAHTHLFLAGGETATAARCAYLKRRGEEHLAAATTRLARLVNLGVTAVREAGDRTGVGLALQARYRSPETRGLMPYVDAPGAVIHHRGRYGSFLGDPLENHADAAAVVNDRIAAGAHRLKLIATGIIDFKKGTVTTKPQLPADELITFVEAARDRGLQTMVHCSGHDGVANCLAARVDTIEHGFFIDDEQLARVRDLDMAWVPTFAPVQFQFDHPEIMGWDERIRGQLRRILDDHARSLQQAVRLGVRVIAGSDAGSPGVAHGWGFLRELELMEQAGLTAAQVLHTATGAGAERMAYKDRFGLLVPGALSRFLLTEHDVLGSVRHLREPKLVVFDGQALARGDDESVAGL